MIVVDVFSHELYPVDDRSIRIDTVEVESKELITVDKLARLSLRADACCEPYMTRWRLENSFAGEIVYVCCIESRIFANQTSRTRLGLVG